MAKRRKITLDDDDDDDDDDSDDGQLLDHTPDEHEHEYNDFFVQRLSHPVLPPHPNLSQQQQISQESPALYTMHTMHPCLIIIS